MILPVLLAMSLVSCTHTRKPETPTGAHFTIMTYNVNFGGPAPELAIDAIRQADPDIICLQETNPDWEEIIGSKLGHFYPFSHFRHEPYAGGMAILSKWKLEEVTDLDPKIGWFPAQRAIIKTPAGPIQILNVHLRPPRSDDGSFVSGYFTTPKVREKEIEARWTQLKPDIRTIVIGDFNEDDGGRAVAFAHGHGYTDALAEFDTRTPTWHWRVRMVDLTSRLDHILYSPGFHCFSAQVLREEASDHYPVIATMGAN